MNRLLPRTFREAIADRGVEPVGDPHLQHMDAFIEGAPLKYKAEFEVKPQIELGQYRGLEIDEPTIEVADHDVESVIERLREQASAYRPETERGLEDGTGFGGNIGHAREGAGGADLGAGFHGVEAIARRIALEQRGERILVAGGNGLDERHVGRLRGPR